MTNEKNLNFSKCGSWWQLLLLSQLDCRLEISVEIDCKKKDQLTLDCFSKKNRFNSLVGLSNWTSREEKLKCSARSGSSGGTCYLTQPTPWLAPLSTVAAATPTANLAPFQSKPYPYKQQQQQQQQQLFFFRFLKVVSSLFFFLPLWRTLEALDSTPSCGRW